MSVIEYELTQVKLGFRFIYCPGYTFGLHKAFLNPCLWSKTINKSDLDIGSPPLRPVGDILGPFMLQCYSSIHTHVIIVYHNFTYIHHVKMDFFFYDFLKIYMNSESALIWNWVSEHVERAFDPGSWIRVRPGPGLKLLSHKRTQPGSFTTLG